MPAVLVVLLVLSLPCVLLMAERLYWINSRTYSLWLSSDLPVGVFSVDQMRDYCDDSLQFTRKDNGMFIRCGMLRTDGPVWDAPAGSRVGASYERMFHDMLRSVDSVGAFTTVIQSASD